MIRGSAEGTSLIDTGSRPGGQTGVPGTLLTLLALAAALVLAGCAAGGAGSSQSPGQEEQSPQTAGSSEGSKLEHPSLGSADAPVVLTEYSDYQ